MNGQVSSPVPVGTVIAYLGEPASLEGSGWLLCDGSPLPIKDYKELFAVLQWNYGYGNDQEGRKHFSLPDLRGMFLRGVDMGRKVDKDAELRTSPVNQEIIVGDYVGTIEQDAIQKHKHTDSGHNHATNATAAVGQVDSDNSGQKAAPPNPPTATIFNGYANLGDPVDSGTGGGQVRLSTETRPINFSVYYIIKAK